MSTLWDVPAKNREPQTFTYSKAVLQGHSDTLGFSISQGVEIGVELGAKLVFKSNVTLSYSHTFNASETTTNTTPVTVHPVVWGWVTGVSCRRRSHDQVHLAVVPPSDNTST